MTEKVKSFSGRRNRTSPKKILLLFIFLPLFLQAQSPQALKSFNDGVSFYTSKQYNQAEASLKEAIRLDPAYAAPHYKLGLYYEEVVFDFEKAVDHYSSYIRLRGENANQAHQSIQRIVTLKVKFPPQKLAQVQQALASYNASVKDIEKRNYAAAILKLNSAVSVIPFYIDAIYARGLAHSQQKNYKLALQDLELVHFYDPTYKDIKYYLAVTYDLFSMRSKQAMSLYRAYLLKTDIPDDRRKIVQNLLFNMEKIEEIKTKAYAGYQAKEYQKVELLYKDALNLRPNDITVLNNMGALLMHQGSYSTAEQYFLQAKNLNPYDPYPSYNLSCLYSLKKDKNTALAYFRAAFPHMPENLRKHAVQDEDLTLIRSEIQALLSTTP